MNEKLPNSEIIKKSTSWKTTIFFTKKALTHILDQHSESNWLDKAKQMWKICFQNQKEIEDLADIILQNLTSEIEYERSCWMYIPYHELYNKVSYRPFQKNFIVQIKPIWKNAFEIVSFYKNKNLKWHSSKKMVS
jgi:hypothetical protein